MTFILRDYQEKSVNYALNHAQEMRPIHIAPCGSGKTLMQAFVAKREFDRGNGTAILTPRNEIFDQTYEMVSEICGSKNVTRLRAKREGESWNPVAPVHIVSWPTLISRAKRSKFWFPRVDRVLVDEVHLSGAKKILEILEHYSDKATIDGYTATPARQTGKGLGVFFTNLMHVTTVRQLTKAGHLCGLEYWGGATPDLKGIKISRGDYEIKKLSNVCVELVGDVIDNWLRLASDRHTIVFAVDIAHCEMLAHRFKGAGVSSAALHTRMTPEDRDVVNDAFKAGKIQVLVNVGIACLDEQTEILTSSGWVGHQEITKEHQIANWDQGNIVFKKPIAINVRDRKTDERMVFLETKNRSIRVTENHRMLYRTWTVGKFKEAKAHEIVDKACQLPICGIAEPFPVIPAQEQHKKRKLWQNAYMLRQAGFVGDARKEAERRAKDRDALCYKNPSELSIPECEFIGFWLGDGSVTKQKCGSMAYSLSQSERYLGIIKWIDELLSNLAYDFRRRRTHDSRANRLPMIQWSIPRGTGFGPQKRKGLYAIEPYLEKNGTDLFWGLNEAQFDALICGFWMADGVHGKADQPITDRWHISNTNKGLLDLLQAIACCRGYRASLYESPQNRNRGHKELWNLRISRRDNHHMTKCRLQFEDDWKLEKVWCVQVDSSYIVTRRRGTVTVMGNSYGYDAPSVNCVVIARPTKSIVMHIQMMGRCMRPKPDGSAALILDHAGNVHNLGMADDLFRWRLDEGKKACENWTRNENSGEAKDSASHTCKDCQHIFTRSRVCPKCGWTVPFSKRDVETVDANLVRIGKNLLNKLPDDWPSHSGFYCMLKRYGAEHKPNSFKPGWASMKYKELTGVWPERHWANMASIPVAPRVLNWITKQQQNYARKKSYGKKKREAVNG